MYRIVDSPDGKKLVFPFELYTFQEILEAVKEAFPNVLTEKLHTNVVPGDEILFWES